MIREGGFKLLYHKHDMIGKVVVWECNRCELRVVTKGKPELELMKHRCIGRNEAEGEGE